MREALADVADTSGLAEQEGRALAPIIEELAAPAGECAPIRGPEAGLDALGLVVGQHGSRVREAEGGRGPGEPDWRPWDFRVGSFSGPFAPCSIGA